MLITHQIDTRQKPVQEEEVSLAKVEAQIGPYEIGRIIGHGMIGVALLARHVGTKRVYCLKCMQKRKIVEKNLAKNIWREVKFMVELKDQDFIMPVE